MSSSNLNLTVEIIKVSSNTVANSCRVLEFLMVIFLSAQYLKSTSNYKSAYFVILNIGYIADLTILLNWALPLNHDVYAFSMILHTWHNTYFVTIWNAILCLNRCTALAFSIKHEKIWTPFSMAFILIFMLIFPFFIDGYQFLHFSCSPTNMAECLIFRKSYFFKGTLTNAIFNSFLGIFIGYSMFKSRKTNKIEIHSLHAKIERRLIYQAIFSSIFQLIFFILNYISSIVIDVQTLQIFVYISQIGYHLQHYAVMVTHFVFSPTFKIAFLNFYYLNWILRKNGKKSVISPTTTKLKSKSSPPLKITKIFVPQNIV